MTVPDFVPNPHTPLVSKELWDKVQEVVRAKGHRFDTKHNYPFNRLIECEHCGHYILGALAKQKYLYYRCAHYNKNHKNGYLKENELMDKLGGIVKDIELPKDVDKKLAARLRYFQSLHKQQPANGFDKYVAQLHTVSLKAIHNYMMRGNALETIASVICADNMQQK